MATTSADSPIHNATQPCPSPATGASSPRDVTARTRTIYSFSAVYTHPTLGHLATHQRDKHGPHESDFHNSTLYQLKAGDKAGDFALAVIRTFPNESSSTNGLPNRPFKNIRSHKAKSQVEIQYFQRFMAIAETTPVRFDNRDILPVPSASKSSVIRFLFTNFVLPPNYDGSDSTILLNYLTSFFTEIYQVGDVLKIEVRFDQEPDFPMPLFQGTIVVYIHSPLAIEEIEKKVPNHIPEEVWPSWRVRTKTHRMKVKIRNR
ncbi:hypothetical protein DFQ27_009616 [Actinomortierella ambigua]|uniref:Uncharacterized protein n=1 Tax=Actinomortierella ambigua TaxID=1343610 RepID=A0A9P6UAJ8_9FUNG|nr:hypothetical protein DFQ27_009616 [Actinomortierella ambigua]